MISTTKRGIRFALLAAALYALNSPLSKWLLSYVPPMLMAGFLYLGAGLGMILLRTFRKHTVKGETESKLSRDDLPATVAMIVLDIAAPIFLMIGLSQTNAATVSLLNNFEIVATACIALLFFKESISPRLWLGILFVTLSCCILSLEDIRGFSLSRGCLFILLAASCWGLENNCTRKLSDKDPLEIVLLKGIFSGCGSILLGFLLGERVTSFGVILPVLCLGFVAYGLSIYYYVYAQRFLGAAKTSAYYAVSPFIAVLLSLLLFRTIPNRWFFFSCFLMLIGTWLSSGDTPLLSFRKKRFEKQNLS